MQTPLLTVKQLNAWYGGAHILFDLSFSVKRGEVVALMGRNGAGKSTSLKAMMGMLAKTSGEIIFRGKDLSGLAPYQIARLGLGFVPEERRIFTDLSVMENLLTGRQAARVWEDGSALAYWTEEKMWGVFPPLKNLRHRLASQMSGGEQQMLSVARSLMGNPYLLLLDEPSEGVAPIMVDQLKEMVLTLKSQGVGVVLSEQNMDFVMSVADRAYFLEKGEIKHHASIHELKEDSSWIKQYLSL